MDKIKSIPIVTLSTFGHCGIDWLHSFIDSHNEVLIIPQLSFFAKILPIIVLPDPIWPKITMLFLAKFFRIFFI